jgi:thioredoxin reductase
MKSSEQMPHRFDVVVVGGGAAGLSGALMLARSRRSVLVVDAGSPRNAPATGVHGLLGHDGLPPLELLSRGRAEVRHYGGQLWSGTITSIAQSANGLGRRGDAVADVGFTARLADGRTVQARRVLVATGLADELPDVPGVSERWGRDVLHCPYCHGWEVRDQAIGVLATGPMAAHQAQLFRQLSDDVVVFTHNGGPLDPAEAQPLTARGIRLIDGRVQGLVVEDDRLVGVHLADGTVVPRQAVVVGPRMVAHARVLAELGLAAVEHSSGMAEVVPCDATGATVVPGVWVAGNVTDPVAQVGGAAAAGALAGAHINASLVADETAFAVAAVAAGA